MIEKIIDAQHKEIIRLSARVVELEAELAALKSDQFAQDLKDTYGECLTDEGDINDPCDWWLQDLTVEDITEFMRNYKHQQ